MNRAFSASGLALQESLGRCPRLVMNAAPLALDRCGRAERAIHLAVTVSTLESETRTSRPARTQKVPASGLLALALAWGWEGAE
jgi:hypothetical protein